MRQKDTLKWQMLRLLALGWFIPLSAIVLIFMMVVAGRIDRQAELTIDTSMEKASEICELRISDCIDASKQASYLPDIRNAWAAYGRDGKEGILHDRTTEFLAQQYRYNPNFDLSLLIYTQEPENVYYTGNATGRGSTSKLRYFKDHVQEEVLKRSTTLDTDVDFFSRDGHVYMMRNMMNRGFEPMAVLVMELNDERIFASLKSVWAYQGMSIYHGEEMLTSDGSIHFVYDAGMPDAPGVFRTESGDEAEVCYRSGDRDHRFLYAVSYDGVVVNMEKHSITVVFCLLLLFLIPLIAVVFYFFHKKVSQPISTLADASRQISEGNYGITVEEAEGAPRGEVDDLTHNFNLMSKKLSEQFNKIFVEEIALRDANIHALQSQINPHFLNNTLEIINWEARIHGEEKVSSMIEALSTMMAATMDRNRQSLISLSEEMEYVMAYLYIIECRYQDRFTHEEKIDERLLHVKVPRLIIQPVVENAVEYASGEEGRHVRIEADGIAEGSRIDMQIRIINPGVPTEEEWERIQELLSPDDEINPQEERSARIGIRNVHRRLRMLYGQESGLSITTDGKGNTVCVLRIVSEGRSFYRS